MSRKTKHPSRQPPVAASTGALSPLAEEAAAVAELVGRGRASEAMDRAKARCKHDPSPEAEALLARAFGARIDELLAAGKPRDAEALLRVALARVPAQAALLAPQRRGLALAAGDAGPLLGALARPETPAPLREELLAEIRRRVIDPAQVAGAEALPPDHPLRVEAGILSRALQAVTSGPVDVATLGLEVVGAESPLSPWATLVRAIAALHRGDDPACLDLAATLPRDTPPGRLAPVFARLLSAEVVEGTRAAEALLRQGVIGDPAGLARALEAVDRAVERRSGADLARAVAAAERAAAGIDADGLQRLRRMIFARATDGGIPETGLARLARPVPDAGYWEEQARIALRSLELERSWEVAGDAIQALEEWRRHGIAEGRIRAGSPEEVALLLKQAELVEDLELTEHRSALLDDVADDQQRWLWESYQGAPPEVRERGSSRPVLRECRNAGDLFARAAAASPGPAVFRRWYDWAFEEGDEEADAVAQQWTEDRPADPEPHRLLVEAALVREDPMTAQALLDAAVEQGAAGEALRALQVQVPLKVAFAHLLRNELDRVEPALSRLDPEPVTTDPLPGCLRLVLALRRGDAVAARGGVQAILAAVGDPAVAHVLVHGAVGVSGVTGDLVDAPAPPDGAEPAALALAVTRAMADAARIGISCPVPDAWRDRILAEVVSCGAGLGGPELLRLADAAGDGDDEELIHAAMAASLALPGKHQVEALTARSRDLPDVWPRRIDLCYRAALDLLRDWEDVGLEDLVEERGYELDAERGEDGHVLSLRPLPRSLTLRLIEREAADRVLPEAPSPEGDWWTEHDPEWVRRWRKEDPEERSSGAHLEPWGDDEEGWEDDDAGEPAEEEDVSPVMSREAARRKADRSAGKLSQGTGLDLAHLTAFHEASHRFGLPMPPVEGVRRHDPVLAERLAAAYDYLRTTFGGEPLPGPADSGEQED